MLLRAIGKHVTVRVLLQQGDSVREAANADQRRDEVEGDIGAHRGGDRHSRCGQELELSLAVSVDRDPSFLCFCSGHTLSVELLGVFDPGLGGDAGNGVPGRRDAHQTYPNEVCERQNAAPGYVLCRGVADEPGDDGVDRRPKHPLAVLEHLQDRVDDRELRRLHVVLQHTEDGADNVHSVHAVFECQAAELLEPTVTDRVLLAQQCAVHKRRHTHHPHPPRDGVRVEGVLVHVDDEIAATLGGERGVPDCLAFLCGGLRCDGGGVQAELRVLALNFPEINVVQRALWVRFEGVQEKQDVVCEIVETGRERI
eukprot:PhM_4_TR16140/c0_g1_i1/m.38255